MIIILLAILAGIEIGLWAPIIPYEFARYSAIAIVAAFDSIMGALNAIVKNIPENKQAQTSYHAERISDKQDKAGYKRPQKLGIMVGYRCRTYPSCRPG